MLRHWLRNEYKWLITTVLAVVGLVGIGNSQVQVSELIAGSDRNQQLRYELLREDMAEQLRLHVEESHEPPAETTDDGGIAGRELATASQTIPTELIEPIKQWWVIWR